MTHVRLHYEKIEVQNVGDKSESILDLLAVHDPKTRFIFWHVERGMDTNVTTWLDGMWAIPDLGLIRVLPTVRGIRIEIYNTQAESYEKWKKGMLEELAIKWAKGAPLTACEELRVNLDDSLGMDFFARPGDASLPPHVKISSVKYSNNSWELELQSGVTDDKATIYLDAAFKVMRAFRNGKQVY